MIVVNNITKKFARVKALDKVSVTLSDGQCIAVIGPNGCGKTTLLKSLLGMVVPESGTIHFNNESITGKWMYRKRFGYMPQMGRYPENMTIANVISMMKDIRKEKISPNMDEELVISLGLEGIMHKKMGTLSGGTIQKVSAALAFMFNPDVLILDEPTAGLDPLSSEELKLKIIRENQNGKLVLITSHILSELDELITEVVYMQEGKITFHKKLDELKEQTGESKLSRAIAKILSKQEFEGSSINRVN